jgi:hypothetical protein
MSIEAVKPVKISHGELWSTKTYVNDFVESPDGKHILYRYLSDPANQPPDIADRAHAAQVWTCGPDGSDRRKLLDVPSELHEHFHGSESMVWLDDDRFYLNGMCYSLSAGRVLWRIPNPCEPRREISAWTYPAKGKLFVNVRTGANKGYYWVDPYVDEAPPLVPFIREAELWPFLGGEPEEYQYTYIFLSTKGSHVYFVLYYRQVEFAFTCREDGTGLVQIGSNHKKWMPWNGHTVWFDDEQLAFPCSPEQNTKLCDRFGENMRVLGGKSNHVTVSPDRNWVACDDWDPKTYNPSFVRLYPAGSTEAVADLMGDDERPTQAERLHTHPSFSRDGKLVYYLGRNGHLGAIYYADVSKWTAG